MAPEPVSVLFGSKPVQAELDAISNRIQIALAKREELIRSWTLKSAREDKTPRKTDAEIDAEDALLFQMQPPYLGVGCPIPEKFLIGEQDRSKKSLEARLGKGLQATKRRDAEEKAASAKRGLRGDSSDEEEGRSAVGKRKKKKGTTVKAAENPIYAMKVMDVEPVVSEVKEVNGLKSAVSFPCCSTTLPIERITVVHMANFDLKNQETAQSLPIRSKDDKRKRRNEKKKKKRKTKNTAQLLQTDSQSSSS